MKIMAASAIAPGTNHKRAISIIAAGVADPVLGPISIDHVQLCPQHASALHNELVDDLMKTYPSTQFRVHATPRVRGDHIHTIVDASNVHDYPEQMAETAAISKRLGATAYSIHAGRTRNATLATAFDNVRRLSDLFGCRVGIEPLYPSPGIAPQWLLGTWAEHEQLLEADVDFAIDTSHLQIVAKREKIRRDDLVTDLLSSPRLIEAHVSWNNDRADQHRPLDPAASIWWLPLLNHIHPDAVIFYEGVLADPRPRNSA